MALPQPAQRERLEFISELKEKLSECAHLTYKSNTAHFRDTARAEMKKKSLLKDDKPRSLNAITGRTNQMRVCGLNVYFLLGNSTPTAPRLSVLSLTLVHYGGRVGVIPVLRLEGELEVAPKLLF